MFRLLSKVTSTTMRVALKPTMVRPSLVSQVRLMSGGGGESDAEFDARYVAYFDRADIDGWEIRKGMADLCAMDMVPEPVIVASALRACRRINDYSLTTRILEIIKIKCGDKEAEFWPYIMQELKPTMDELGILSIEEMGYNQPELALPNPYEIH
eukprot:TRINITY_DN3821_c0_g1_i1.p1 TRINITY_DN3821_c0_g1~~TRINITY_DN3821_c0_g1_i1.p1  ORF type:complete len:155 (-),score=54.90 TRINITY_DN3821_c0_g1_i1:112-576(-)